MLISVQPNKSIQKVPSPPWEERASAYLVPMVGVRGGDEQPYSWALYSAAYRRNLSNL